MGPRVDGAGRLQRLGPGDLALMDQLLTLFGEVFGEQETYSGRRPRPE